MKTLENNIVNKLGQRGYEWLDRLPELVSLLSDKWDLSNATPVDKMSWNYVSKALQHQRFPVILKLSWDLELLESERAALMHFAGSGVIQVRDYDKEHGALLLQQAIPGNTLKSIYPDKLIYVMNAFASIIHKIADVAAPVDYKFKHVREWLSAIDNAKTDAIPQRYLDKAKIIKEYLLQTHGREILLHGDLHLENILNNGSEWLAIDPQGIIGEIEFEVAAFDLIGKEEIERYKSISNIIYERIDLLSEMVGIQSSRLTGWIYLRIIMSALWFIEDNGNPEWPLLMAGYVYQLLE